MTPIDTKKAWSEFLWQIAVDTDDLLQRAERLRKEVTVFNLTEWMYLFTFGYDLKVYARGQERVGVDPSGKAVIQYTVKG